MTDVQRMEAFGRMIKKLGDHFTPLDADKVDVYYDRLKSVDITTLLYAADAIIDHSPFRRFPLVNEFWKAIAAVRKTQAFRRYRAERDAQIGVCAKCKGEGVYTQKDVPFPDLGPAYSGDVARFCDCRTGQRRGESLARIMSAKASDGAKVKLNYKDEPDIEVEADDDHDGGPL